MAVHEQRIEIQPSSVVSMISRKEMPSMPSTYPAPMEGIQLFGVPSMNLKPGSKRSAQNIATSGSEIRKPPSAKKLAIQRMASLFSFGTNRSTRAPSSGVNKMIESIWFCMKDQLLASSFLLLAESQERPAGSCVSVIHVIKNETYQACSHHQRIPLDQTPFEKTRGIRKHARQSRRAVDANAVDDPLVPPTGNCCSQTRDPSGCIDRAIDDMCVEP